VCQMNRSEALNDTSVELPTPLAANVSFLFALLSLILSWTICNLLNVLYVLFYFDT
jgi:hypothetical protein